MLGRFVRSLIDPLAGASKVPLDWLETVERMFGADEYGPAESLLDQVLAAEPGNVEALHWKGLLLRTRGCGDEALIVFRRALSLSPDNIGLTVDLAGTLLRTGQPAQAESTLRAFLDVHPDAFSARRLLGRVLLEMRRVGESITCLEKALQNQPDDRLTQLWLGSAAYRSYDYPRAKRLLLKAHNSAPLDWQGQYMLGAAYFQLGELNHAREFLSHALEMAPHESEIALMLGYVCLTAGEWDEGFRLHEQRLDSMRQHAELGASHVWIRQVDRLLEVLPSWEGESLAGKRILIWREQGHGDVIMLSRLMPALLDKYCAERVTFLGSAPERCVIEMLGRVDFIDAASVVTPFCKEQFDVQCSIMSLPHRMKLVPKNIPGVVPYLSVPVPELSRWKALLGMPSRLRVGLVWSGSREMPFNWLRSLSAEDLLSLLRIEGVEFHSLQKGGEPLPVEMVPLVQDHMAACQSYLDTAGLICNLDLVISVCTSVAHLAGALGKPVWLLNRLGSDWRWMRGREDSVWYPSMRIFNQTAHADWRSVIERATGELSQLASCGAPSAAARESCG